MYINSKRPRQPLSAGERLVVAVAMGFRLCQFSGLWSCWLHASVSGREDGTCRRDPELQRLLRKMRRFDTYVINQANPNNFLLFLAK